MAEGPATLVTCLFDLGTREESKRRSVEEYLEWGQFVLIQDQPLICFADPGIAGQILARRNALQRGASTHVIPIALEELPCFALRDAIVRARTEHPLRNFNPAKDTPLYTLLGWSRTYMIQRAIAENPFRSSHFAWIDFGIAHAAILDHCSQDQVLRSPADRLRLLMLRNWCADDLRDRRYYFSFLRGHVAAGLLTGETTAYLEYCRRFDEERSLALQEGFAPSDEQLIPLVTDRDPERFEFYYGDYRDILENYRHLRGGATHLLEQMRNCRALSDFRRGLDIGLRIVESHRKSRFVCAPATLSALLDEAFIAAYYAEFPNQTTAAAIARYYVSLTEADPQFMSAFHDTEAHIRSNLNHLHESVW